MTSEALVPIGTFTGSDLVPVHEVKPKERPKSLSNVDTDDLVLPQLLLLQGASPAVTQGVEGARPGLFMLSNSNRIIKPPLRVLVVHHHKSRYFQPDPEKPRHAGLKRCISRDGVSGTEYGLCAECRLGDWEVAQDGSNLKPLCPPGHNFALLIEDEGATMPVLLRVNLSNKDNKRSVKNVLSTLLLRGLELWQRLLIIGVRPVQKTLPNGKETTYYVFDMRWQNDVLVPESHQIAGASQFDFIEDKYQTGKFKPEETVEDEDEGEYRKPPF